MAEVIILLTGYTTDEDPNKGSSPTITLIKDNNVNIIVDPGSVKDRNMIIGKLKEQGLEVDDINLVCITHSHMDHYMHIGMFPNAKAFDYWGLWHEDKLDDFKSNCSKDITVIKTPGHNYDGITLLVKTEKGIIAICGDVFWREGYPDNDPYATDMKKLQESRKKVLAAADWIIPGHGDMFKVRK